MSGAGEATVRQLAYVGIGVGEIAAWQPLTDEILGLECAAREPDGSLLLRMDERHHRIALHPTGEDDLAYVGWEVDDATALETIAERLRHAGLPVEAASPADAAKRRVRRLVRFRDPSGIASEIAIGPERAPGSLRAARAHGGFEAGALGLGHLNLVVRDLDESLRFYVDLLGMRVSDYIDFDLKPGTRVTAAFLRCNPRHHTLALVSVPVRRRLLHVLLEMRSIDDVGATLELCQRRGLPVATSLGRHPNDRMLSFYVRTPSGFDVECGTGGRLVDDRSWRVERYDTTSVWGHERRLPRPSTEDL